MDQTATANKFAEDAATRESLIELSYQVPDKDLTAENSPKHLNGGPNIDEPLNHDVYEKYRSELISISYSLSPDVSGQPLLPQV